MTFSEGNIRYEYDVFSRNKQVLILPYRLNIAAVTVQPNQDGTRHSARHGRIYIFPAPALTVGSIKATNFNSCMYIGMNLAYS